MIIIKLGNFFLDEISFKQDGDACQSKISYILYVKYYKIMQIYALSAGIYLTQHNELQKHKKKKNRKNM